MFRRLTHRGKVAPCAIGRNMTAVATCHRHVVHYADVSVIDHNLGRLLRVAIADCWIRHYAIFAMPPQAPLIGRSLRNPAAFLRGADGEGATYFKSVSFFVS